MTIYKDKNGVVISINEPVEGCEAVDISDDPEACEYYAKCGIGRFFHSDGRVDHYIIPPQEESEDDKLRSQVENLTATLNILLGVSD